MNRKSFDFSPRKATRDYFERWFTQCRLEKQTINYLTFSAAKRFEIVFTRARSAAYSILVQFTFQLADKASKSESDSDDWPTNNEVSS